MIFLVFSNYVALVVKKVVLPVISAQLMNL